MISYRTDQFGKSLSYNRLLKLVSEHDDKWLDKAATRTNDHKVLGKLSDKSDFWSDIKAVFMRIQGNKCAFCERMLEPEQLGKIEHDVEHFRPKGRVSKWEPSASLAGVNIGKITSTPPSGGYFLLAYDIRNYSMGCKSCNSTLKGDRFPILGKYMLSTEDIAEANKLEKPLLLFPIGTSDKKAEDLISFNGVFPIPTKKTGINRKRALVTIDFFSLGDPTQRPNLFKERASKIQLLFLALSTRAHNHQLCDQIIEQQTNAHSPHANCGRAFVDLYNQDPVLAESFAQKAGELVDSISSIS